MEVIDGNFWPRSAILQGGGIEMTGEVPVHIIMSVPVMSVVLCGEIFFLVVSQ